MQRRAVVSVALGLALGTPFLHAAAGVDPACKAANGGGLVYIGSFGSIPHGGTPTATPNEQTKDMKQGIFSACFNRTTGDLSVLGPVAEIQQASWLVADTKHSFLYATGIPGMDLKVEANIYSFAIDRSNGKLRAINQVGSGGLDATHLALNPAADAIFVANNTDGKITSIPIQKNGTLDKVVTVGQDTGSGPAPRQTGPRGHGVAVDPTGHYLVAADFGADRLFIRSIDPKTKALTDAVPPFEQAPAGSGPRHLTFHPNGKFLFVNTELTAEVYSYSFDPKTGHLALVQKLSAYPADWTADKSGAEIAVSPNGKYLYLSLRGTANGLVAYQVDPAKGTLQEIQRVPAGGKTPWSFTIDPTGHWMLVANVASNSVQVFKIDPATGKLTPQGNPVTALEPATFVFAD